MTKTLKKGFTIVELLIVIVVIGILAAIVVVTYQGVQNKANTTAAEQNAREVANKAAAFNATATSYPKDETELKDAKPASGEVIPEAKLSEKVSALIGDVSATDRTKVKYTACSKTGAVDVKIGAVVQYWDYTNNEISAKAIRTGETKGTDNSCNAIP